jgi:hypothetical protein
MYFYYQQLSMTSWQDTMTKIKKNENFLFFKSIFNNEKIICYISQVKLQ